MLLVEKEGEKVILKSKKPSANYLAPLENRRAVPGKRGRREQMAGGKT